MSTVIDSKVVEMRFDNSKFEPHVKESMSTLDKLKNVLSNFTGKKSSLDIDTSKANSDLNSVSSTVITIGEKFNVLEKIATGALYKIGSQAVETGERLLKSLSVDQISAGYSKYNEKTASVQTLVNSTGKSVEEINGYLSKLMWYSDETSYSFTEMTSALAQMTSTGGNIDDLVPTIMGIANATAYAGKGADAFVHTIRNLGQSYNAGYLQLMDWKSLQLAGTASKQLTEELIHAGEALGKIKKGSVTVENFADKLKNKWADTEVMEMAFSRFAKASQDVYGMVESGSFDTASEALASLGDDYDDLAKKAFQSAQEAKSFSEAIDATKDAVSSGWMTTFELIFGNYDQAKKLWTDLANGMWDFFAGGASDRNDFLAEVLGEKWDILTGKIEAAGVSTEDFERALEHVAQNAGLHTDVIKNMYGTMTDWIRETSDVNGNFISEALVYLAYGQEQVGDATKVTTKNLEEFQKVVRDIVINGKYGNGADRIKALTEAGYDYAEVQGIINKLWRDGNGSFKNLNLTSEDLANSIEKLSDAELKSVGYTEEQITLLRELAVEASTANTPLSQLIEDLQKPSGRTLLIESMANILASLVDVIDLVKQSFRDIFPAKTANEWYNFIEALHKSTSNMRAFLENDDNAKKLIRTFKGLFAILDIISTLVGGVLKIGFEILKGVLKAFGLDILDATASLGDFLVKIRDWIDKHNIINKIVEKTVPIIVNFIKKIQNLTKEGGFLNTAYKNLISVFKDIKTEWDKWIQGLKETDNVPRYIAESLATGFVQAAEFIGTVIGELGTFIIEGIKSILGLGTKNEDSLYGSGSKAFSDFADGFKEGIQPFIENFKVFAEDIKKKFLEMDWGKIAAAGLATLLTASTFKLARGVELLTSIVEPVATILERVGRFIDQARKSLKKVGKALSNDLNASVVLKFAASIGILAWSVKLISDIDTGKAWSSVAIISALIFEMAGILALVNYLTKDNKFDKSSIATIFAYRMVITAIGLMIIEIALAMKLMSTIEADAWDRCQNTLLIIAASVITILYMLGKSTASFKEAEFITFAKILKGLGLLFIEAAIAMKIVGSMNSEDFKQAEWFIASMGVLFAIIAKNTEKISFMKALDNFGNMMIKLGIAFILTAASMKIVGSMSLGNFIKGELFLASVTGMVLAIMYVTKLLTGSKVGITTFGNAMIQIGSALLLTAVAFKIIGGMSLEDLAKGEIFLLEFSGFIGLMALITKNVNNELKGFSLAMLSLSASLLIMVIAIKLIGKLSISEILKGGLALLALSGVLAILSLVTKSSGEITKGLGVQMLALAASLLILTAVIFLLGHMDAETVIKGGLAITALMGVVTAMTILIKMTPNNGIGELGGLVGLAVVIAVLAASVAILSFFDAKDLTKATLTIDAVMAALTGLLIAVGKIDAKDNDIKVIILVAAILAEITACIAILINISKDSNEVLKCATGLTELITALTGAIYVLSKSKIEYSDIAKAGLMGLIIGELAVVLALITELGIEHAIQNATALSELILALSGACYILTKIGPAATAGYEAIKLLDVLIADLTLVAIALGGLFEILPISLLDNAIEVMSKLGEMIGSFVSGIGVGLTSGLPQMGKDLADFAENIKPFMEMMETYSNNPFDILIDMAAAFAAIAGEHILDSILENSFIGFLFGDKWTTFKDNLTALGTALGEFAGIVKDIPEADLKKVQAAADAAALLAEFQDKLPREKGYLQTIIGNKQSLQKFGEGIKELMLVLMSTTTLSEHIKSDKIREIADACGFLADVQNKLPEDGGLKQNILGHPQSLSILKEGLPELATALAKASGGALNINNKQIEKIATSAGYLAELQDKLPRAGGYIDTIIGDQQTLGTFSKCIVKFGEAIMKFYKSVEELDDVDRFDKIVTAAGKLGDLQSALNGTSTGNGVIDYFLGKQMDLSNLGGTLESFGEGIMKFYESIKDMEDVDKFSSVVEAAKGLAEIQTALGGTTEGGIIDFFLGKQTTFETFGGDLEALGKGLKKFSESISGENELDKDAVTKAVDFATELVSLATTLAGNGDGKSIWDFASFMAVGNEGDETTLSGFGSALTELGKDLNDFNEIVKGIDFNEKTEQALTGLDKLINFSARINALSFDNMYSFVTALNLLTDIDLDGLIEIFSKEGTGEILKNITAFCTTIRDKLDEGSISIKELMTSKTNEVINAIFGVFSEKRTEFGTNGFESMRSFASGIGMSGETVKQKINTVMAQTTSAIKDKYSDFTSAGFHLMMGLKQGIEDGSGEVLAKAEELANQVNEKIQTKWEIKSPSRVAKKLAYYYDKGLALGLKENSGEVVDTAGRIADDVNGGFASVLSDIYDVIDWDLNPVITPTLDLSYVEASASRLGTILDDSKLGGVVTGQNGEVSGTKSIGATYNFTQNNYSPKALSRIDIYRQTSNQFAQLKGAIG